MEKVLDAMLLIPMPYPLGQVFYPDIKLVIIDKDVDDAMAAHKQFHWISTVDPIVMAAKRMFPEAVLIVSDANGLKVDERLFRPVDAGKHLDIIRMRPACWPRLKGAQVELSFSSPVL